MNRRGVIGGGAPTNGTNEVRKGGSIIATTSGNIGGAAGKRRFA